MREAVVAIDPAVEILAAWLIVVCGWQPSRARDAAERAVIAHRNRFGGTADAPRHPNTSALT